MKKNIELEFRSIIELDDISSILKKIKLNGTLASTEERLSVMFFGTCEKISFDIKVGITNGKSEIAIKKGDFHSHNRTEYNQNISNNQFIDMVKIFSQLRFYAKVCERTT